MITINLTQDRATLIDDSDYEFWRTGVLIEFFVPGNPQAQKRHRSFQKGKFRGTYDPSATDKADFLAKCMEHKPEKPFTGAVRLHIVAYFPRPADHFDSVGEIKQGRPFYYTKKKMDWDNIGKFVSDAFNGVFYLDDCQIVDASVERFYDSNGTPGIKILIEELRK